MNPECGTVWPLLFLQQEFTQAFLQKKWKKHCEDLCYLKEVALLSATQPIVEKKKAMDALEEERKWYQKEYDGIVKKMKYTSGTIQGLHSAIGFSRAYSCLLYKEEIQANELIVKRIQLLNRKLLDRKRICENYLQVAYPQKVQEVESKFAKQIQKFVQSCPDVGCRGFVRDNWICGMCEKQTCAECHKIVSEGHTCNPDDVLTVQMIHQDSKPCPSCRTPISKINGCDQMWCTQCHTAFSWDTGRIETRIHNPHYFDFMRANPGGLARRDYECERDLNTVVFDRLLEPVVFLTGVSAKQDTQVREMDYYRDKLDNIRRHAIHIRNNIIPKYEVDQIDNQPLRIEYLEKKIDEKQFRQKVLQKYNEFAKKKEFVKILRTYFQCFTDILNWYDPVFVASKTPEAMIQSLHNCYYELKTLVSNTNAFLQEVAIAFHGATLVINNDPRSTVKPLGYAKVKKLLQVAVASDVVVVE
jgi:hypothetical protein